MPASDLKIDCRVQEVIFLGYLYSHPEDLSKYVSLLDEVNAFQSREGQHIWRVTNQYYLKYGALPSADVWPHAGFTSDEIDDLTIAVQEISKGSPDYKFMLDTFSDTLQLAIYRNATERFETAIQEGGDRVLETLKGIEDTMLARLLVCRNADKSTMQGTLKGTLDSWFAGGLLFQQPKVAIPIRGMENVSGSPKGAVNLLVGGYGAGKEAPLSLIVPTPAGDRRWGDLKPGDCVFGVHGQPVKILQTFPQGLKDIYCVTFDDGSFTLCGQEHLWTVYGRKSRRYDQRRKWGKVSWKVMTTQEIIDEGVTLKHGKCQPLRQWEIPRIRPVEYLVQQELPVPAYLMGLWLGDGNPTGSVSINLTHNTVCDYIHNTYEVTGCRLDSKQCVQIFGIKGLPAGLRLLGVYGLRSWEKYIPQQYLEASVEDRYELLRGLLDSDGECDKNGVTLVYSSSSQKLVEQVLFLARGLGGKGSMRAVKHPTFTYKGEKKQGRASYSCSFVLPPEFGCPFRSIPNRAERFKPVSEERYLIRWIDKIEKLGYQEECMCIKVEAEDGLYLANDFIPTHNTTTLSSMTAYLLRNYNVLYVTLETNADAIMFKILSNLTSGKIRAKSVHELPNSERITSQEYSALKAFKVAFDNIDVATQDDEAIELELDGAQSAVPLKTLFHLTMSPGTATAMQLEIYIREIQRKTGLHIDAVMVDYAALMKTNAGGTKDDIGWSYTGTIMMELAAVAQNLGLVVWTAAQSGGQTAHTVMSTTTTSFKPIRGADVYGSKEVLQNSSLVYGLSFVRSSKYPHLAAGVLSTLKNRYGTEFYDYVCVMNYGLARLQVTEIYDAYAAGEGNLIDRVHRLLRSLELKHETEKNTRMAESDLKNKRRIMDAYKKAIQDGENPIDPDMLEGINVDPGDSAPVEPGLVKPDSQQDQPLAEGESGKISYCNGVAVKAPRKKPLTSSSETPVITPSEEQQALQEVQAEAQVEDRIVKTASKQDQAKKSNMTMRSRLGQRSSADSPF